MGKKTPLYECHVQAAAKMVDFAGWDMPLHYGSQIREHHIVRQDAGMFDVSHMTIVDLTGKDVAAFLRYVLANNIDRLTLGKALYTCMLNAQGGVLDDLIVYKIADDFFRLVINAGTRDKDLAWFEKQKADFRMIITERTDLAMLALQGPKVKDKISHVLTLKEGELVQKLQPFTFVALEDWFIARTGYTGEDGYEIILPGVKAKILWEKALAAEIKPCGLGARDTLRLEAGLNLYGSDMDENVSPLESNLSWTVAMMPKERDFIGRHALEKELKLGPKKVLVGLVLAGPGIIRNHQKVLVNGHVAGEVTSGGYSPTLEKSIA